ncbi:MAG: hypothetical protein GY860_08615 [Desulfobacteraceae bacterium]|nr:hypothetical protein [Desulfobacteraceae bacterium]
MQENTKNIKDVSFGPAIFFCGPDPFFEEQKNGFIAAIYANNGCLAESIYDLIFDKAEKKVHLGETDEKYLRQIQVAFKQFKPFLLSQCSNKILDTYKKLQSLIRKNVRDQSAQPGIVAYNTWKKKVDLESWQQELVFSNAITFQMTVGCSNYCRRCNEWALPKIRSHFSKDAVKTILGKLMGSGNLDLALYGASDPLDWEESNLDLKDILSGLNPIPNFSLLTKIPRGKEELLKNLLKMDINLSVSQTDRNSSRIKALEAQIDKPITKQHASKDLLIPAGLDENFISVKPSITDAYGTEITPEGAWIIIPTFTSALHPFGHKKLPVTSKTTLFPVKKLGRQALLVDYFKPLEVVGKDNNPTHLSTLLDVQVESILLDDGSDELTPPGMRSLKEYFSIFDDIPRLQRKKMTPSVIAKLKKEFVPGNGYKTLSAEKKQLYKKKLKAHLDFCKKNVVAESRLCALSFFLGAVASFIERQPVKGCIIAFLVKEETLDLEKKYKALAIQKKAISLFFAPKANVWEIFRFYATSLISGHYGLISERGPGKAILEFIASYPSTYDPMADRFVPVD